MKQLRWWKALTVILAFLLMEINSAAQSPGLIVRPKNGGVVTFLNPNTDKFSSATSAGFTSSDVTQSEIPYKTMPSLVPEPTGDNNGGPTDGASDFVQGANGSGFYAFYDGTNVLFRFRVGGKSNGSKGYSVLLDTDLKFGNSGLYGDPNFVPQSTARSGNPGFELEVLYAQGKGVQILNVDGTVAGTVIASYPENTHSQLSVALSKTGGDADYFVDFGVPAAALGIGTNYIRLVGTTCVSSSSALQNNASDVWGIDDIPHKSLIPNWTSIIMQQCGIGVTALTANGPGICICTPPPTVNAPINPGANVVVTGTWTRASNIYSPTTVITVFKNGTSIGTLSAATGVPWNFTVPSLSSGDQVYAKAQSAPESMCYQSDPVYVTCTTPLNIQPSILCASTKGIQGTVPLGATVDIYELAASNSAPTKLSQTGMVYTNNGTTNTTFSYYGSNAQSGSPCSGGGVQFGFTSYYLVINSGGCLSTPFFMCISGSSWSQAPVSSTMALTTPIYSNQTTVSGTGGSTQGSSNKTYRLFINGQYVASTSSFQTFSFSNLSLKVGDKLFVNEVISNGSCQTVTAEVTVSCIPPSAPSIVSNNGTILSTETSIAGYVADTGSVVSLYRGTAPGGVLVASMNTGDTREWSVGGLTLAKGEAYYATATLNGCTSLASTVVTIAKATPVCATITGSYTESATSISGTFSANFTGKVRLYNNGLFLKSVDVTTATTWAIPVNQDVTTFTDALSPSDSLSVTTQSSTAGNGETPACSFAFVGCDIPPTPNASPAAVTVSQGQAAAFDMASTSGKVLYTIVDAANSTYGTSVFGTGGAVSMTTTPFNTPGTYNLKLAADNLAAPGCRTTQNIVVVVNSMTLPLRFISLTVKSESMQRKEIKWIATGEQDVSHYIVERSFDGTSFDPIATIGRQNAGSQTGEYSYRDQLTGSQSRVFYRAKAIAIGGGVTVSSVVSVGENETLQPRLAPNPTSTETTLHFTCPREALLTLELVDISGRPVWTKQVVAAQGKNAIVLDGLSKYSRGHYILKLRTAAETAQLKLILNAF